MITCDAVSVSLYRNTGVSLSRHAVTHDFAGALHPAYLYPAATVLVADHPGNLPAGDGRVGKVDGFLQDQTRGLRPDEGGGLG
jgi:hypothetical protein